MTKFLENNTRGRDVFVWVMITTAFATRMILLPPLPSTEITECAIPSTEITECATTAG